MKRNLLAIGILFWSLLPTTWWWWTHRRLRALVMPMGKDAILPPFHAWVLIISEGVCLAVLLGVYGSVMTRNGHALGSWPFVALGVAFTPHWVMLVCEATWPVLTARADKILEHREKQAAQRGDISLIEEDAR